MAAEIKTASEIERMSESNRRIGIVLDYLQAVIRPGISTMEIDRQCTAKIRELGGEPNFLGYEGYPASVCVSINDEIVHGIPKEDRFLREGDIVSLDTGMTYQGWNSDAARTFPVGKIGTEARKLIDATRESFFRGFRMAGPGNHLNDISRAIGDYALSLGYGVVRDLCGHGIGRDMHEDPDVMNIAQQKEGMLLVPGITLAIEPMLTTGTDQICRMDDGWTVKTADGSLAAHYENTILITEDGARILSLTDDLKE